MPKDLFSHNAYGYSLYRPTYPKELFTYILSFVKEKESAWDCATGNGKAAQPLSEYFRKVFATDLSEQQLKAAPKKENIEYINCPAEETMFPDHSFDLITVAQAYHWLNWKKFYTEACRVAKNECVIAVWMYNLLRSEDEKINALIDYFYKEITGPYWDPERKHIDDNYANVFFPFTLLPSQTFTSNVVYSKEDLLGYFSTWSSVKNYKEKKGVSPINLIGGELDNLWHGQETKIFRFPIHLRIGKITH